MEYYPVVFQKRKKKENITVNCKQKKWSLLTQTQYKSTNQTCFIKTKYLPLHLPVF